MLAAPLFGSDTLPQVLSLVVTAADADLTAREVSRRLDTNLESTQRALRRLAEAGVIRPARRGRELRYTLQRDDAVALRDLRATAHRLSGMGEELRERAAQLPRGAVEAAFIFGSMAAGTERPESDFDLFVLGSGRVHDLADFTWRWSQRLQRDVVPIVRTRAALAAGLAEGASFYRNVLTGPKLFLIGSPADLPEVA
ncbi:MAG: nucleotidyltransferase domain-containing protein [Candidatus Dormibacteria bacterium]